MLILHFLFCLKKAHYVKKTIPNNFWGPLIQIQPKYGVKMPMS